MSSPTTAALKRKHASPARRSFEVAASASDKSDKKYIPGGPIANALVVVTGANRGIGLEFCKQILAKSDGNSVVASCREPSAATDLTALQKEMGASRLAIVALDVAALAACPAELREIAAATTAETAFPAKDDDDDDDDCASALFSKSSSFEKNPALVAQRFLAV